MEGGGRDDDDDGRFIAIVGVCSRSRRGGVSLVRSFVRSDPRGGLGALLGEKRARGARGTGRPRHVERSTRVEEGRAKATAVVRSKRN